LKFETILGGINVDIEEKERQLDEYLLPQNLQLITTFVERRKMQTSEMHCMNQDYK
jgi:hypothetical protein